MKVEREKIKIVRKAIKGTKFFDLVIASTKQKIPTTDKVQYRYGHVIGKNYLLISTISGYDFFTFNSTTKELKLQASAIEYARAIDYLTKEVVVLKKSKKNPTEIVLGVEDNGDTVSLFKTDGTVASVDNTNDELSIFLSSSSSVFSLTTKKEVVSVPKRYARCYKVTDGCYAFDNSVYNGSTFDYSSNIYKKNKPLFPVEIKNSIRNVMGNRYVIFNLYGNSRRSVTFDIFDTTKEVFIEKDCKLETSKKYIIDLTNNKLYNKNYDFIETFDDIMFLNKGSSFFSREVDAFATKNGNEYKLWSSFNEKEEPILISKDPILSLKSSWGFVYSGIGTIYTTKNGSFFISLKDGSLIFNFPVADDNPIYIGQLLDTIKDAEAEEDAEEADDSQGDKEEEGKQKLKQGDLFLFYTVDRKPLIYSVGRIKENKNELNELKIIPVLTTANLIELFRGTLLSVDEIVAFVEKAKDRDDVKKLQKIYSAINRTQDLEDSELKELTKKLNGFTESNSRDWNSLFHKLPKNRLKKYVDSGKILRSELFNIWNQ